MKKLAITSLFVLASCATIMEDSMQPVQVSVEPNVPANCSFKGRDFSTQAQVPGEVKIKRSYYPVDVTCTAADGRTGQARVLADVSPVGYGGAVVGLGVGAGVDTATGKAFEYPEKIAITLGTSTTIGKSSTNSNVDFK